MFIQILWIVLALVLLVLCAVLLVFEIFIPSLGLLTVAALMSLAGGLYIFFQIGDTAGWVGVWISAFLIPAVWVIMYRLLPKTSIGRILVLKKNQPAAGGIPDQENLHLLINKNGTVLSPLRPVGMCDFDGIKIVCVSESGYIDKQAHVKVIHVEGNKIVVRKVDTA